MIDKELMNLPQDTLQYLGVIDENGNVIENRVDENKQPGLGQKDECATQVVSEPVQPMAVVNPTLGAAKKLVDKQKKGIKVKKKEEEAVEYDPEAEYIDDTEGANVLDGIESVYDLLENWCVLEEGGFDIKLINDEETFEEFVIKLRNEIEIDVTVFCDGIVRCVTLVGNKGGTICYPTTSPEEFVKTYFLDEYAKYLDKQAKENGVQKPVDLSNREEEVSKSHSLRNENGRGSVGKPGGFKNKVEYKIRPRTGLRIKQK